MSTLSQFMGGGIKSVQRGVFAGSETVTTINISPVNPAKAFVNVTSEYLQALAVDRAGFIRLASSTSLEARSRTSGGNVPIYWEVIEFY